MCYISLKSECNLSSSPDKVVHNFARNLSLNLSVFCLFQKAENQQEVERDRMFESVIDVPSDYEEQGN